MQPLEMRDTGTGVTKQADVSGLREQTSFKGGRDEVLLTKLRLHPLQLNSNATIKSRAESLGISANTSATPGSFRSG